MFPQRLDFRIANDVARAMLDGINRHCGVFRAESARARHRFVTADWHGPQRAQQESIEFPNGEIDHITDGTARRAPAPCNAEEGMSGEVWYAVGPKDVFPCERDKRRFAALHSSGSHRHDMPQPFAPEPLRTRLSGMTPPTTAASPIPSST